MQADKLSICQLFIIIFFTFICDVLTRDIAFFQDISIFICDVTELYFFCFLSFCQKTKNRGDVHETHPPGFINKSDESYNPNSTSFIQNNHIKELKCFSPCTQRLQLATKCVILFVRRRRNSGWWLCVLAHNLSGDVEFPLNKSAGVFFVPRRWEQQYLLLIHCSIYKGLCQEFLQKTGKICIRIKKQLPFWAGAGE